jgi:hypothetical protein
MIIFNKEYTSASPDIMLLALNLHMCIEMQRFFISLLISDHNKKIA